MELIHCRNLWFAKEQIFDIPVKTIRVSIYLIWLPLHIIMISIDKNKQLVGIMTPKITFIERLRMIQATLHDTILICFWNLIQYAWWLNRMLESLENNIKNLKWQNKRMALFSSRSSSLVLDHCHYNFCHSIGSQQ